MSAKHRQACCGAGREGLVGLSETVAQADAGTPAQAGELRPVHELARRPIGF